MYANAALRVDCPLPRFLTERAVAYRSVPKSAVRKHILAEERERPVALLAKEEWCCDRATD